MSHFTYRMKYMTILKRIFKHAEKKVKQIGKLLRKHINKHIRSLDRNLNKQSIMSGQKIGIKTFRNLKQEKTLKRREKLLVRRLMLFQKPYLTYLVVVQIWRARTIQ